MAEAGDDGRSVRTPASDGRPPGMPTSELPISGRQRPPALLQMINGRSRKLRAHPCFWAFTALTSSKFSGCNGAGIVFWNFEGVEGVNLCKLSPLACII